jgi:N-carbamoyl-L-amino-acid hydrolase
MAELTPAVTLQGRVGAGTRTMTVAPNTRRGTNLGIDGARLWGTLIDTARFGGTPKGGVRRLALSEEDRQVRDWFRKACEAAGMEVRVDTVGTMFAIRPGRDAEALPIAMGSHLDTQPTGGKFDGVLGVLAGLEVIRTLNDAGVVTHAPLMIVNWTDEEGARFAPAMLASGVHAGVFTERYALDRADRDGRTFGEELERIGYRGAIPAGDTRFQAMFELHIEQGPILEAEGKDIGVVTGVQGMRWYDVTFRGRDAHTGTTPMTLRRDALLAAARFIAAVNEVALASTGGLATVGRIENRPNSTNTVPGEVYLTVDLRCPDETELHRMEAAMRERLAAICATSGVEAEELCTWNSPPVRFDATLIDCVRRAATSAGFSHRDIVSGAGHDAAYTARIAPTTMIFCPCAGGVSHNEEESVTLEQASAGAQVLLRAVLDLDDRLRRSSAAPSITP